MITLKGKSYRLRERGLDVAPARIKAHSLPQSRRPPKSTPQERPSRRTDAGAPPCASAWDFGAKSNDSSRSVARTD